MEVSRAIGHSALQHTETHCNTLQHTATSCNTLQHAATRCRCSRTKCRRGHKATQRLQHTAAHCNILQHTSAHRNKLQMLESQLPQCSRFSSTIATHCNTLQHTATHCNTLQHTATHCNTLQHTAGALEPTAAELAMLVNEFYSTIASANSGGGLGSMGERDFGVVFQGDGDPLECVGVVLETVLCVAVCCSELQSAVVSCSVL